MRILRISVILMKLICVNGNFLDGLSNQMITSYSNDLMKAMIYESTVQFFIKFCIFLTQTYIQKPSKLILSSEEHHNWNTDITGLESEVSQQFDTLRSMFKDYS